MKISKERNIAINLIYTWAQDHTADWILNGPNQTNEGIDLAGGYLTHVVRHEAINLDLLLLIDRIELLLKHQSFHYKYDGCTCHKCGNFYHMSLPNQSDGTFICYLCRNP